MTATIIDGRKTAKQVRHDVSIQVQDFTARYERKPKLAVILVGDNSASKVYIGQKEKACVEVGIDSVTITLSPSVGMDGLMGEVKRLNEDPNVDGILVQLPLPEDFDETAIIEAIDPLKDVDGFHPVTIGRLVAGDDTLFPCTPNGIVELLVRYGIETKGKHVVIVGRSNIVGKPLANLLLRRGNRGDSTVTVCHSRTNDLAQYTRQADILVAAIGVPDFIQADMVKDGVVVIDVGINRISAPSTKRGYKLVGDVDYDEVSEKASAITPVPGGVGPMTVAMLMLNTVTAARTREGMLGPKDHTLEEF